MVLDPFAGSGTTARAAINLNRRFVTGELEDKYVEHMKSWMSVEPNFNVESVDFVNTEEPNQVGINLKLNL